MQYIRSPSIISTEAAFAVYLVPYTRKSVLLCKRISLLKTPATECKPVICQLYLQFGFIGKNQGAPREGWSHCSNISINTTYTNDGYLEK